jgi:hypothetical protein
MTTIHTILTIAAYRDWEIHQVDCKGNLTNLRRELHLGLAKGNPK